MTETNEPRPEQDPAAAFERRRKQKVWIAGAAAAILGVLLVGRILGGGEKAQQEQQGINTTVPDGKAQATFADKRKAAEQLGAERQQQKRMMTLGDDAFSLLDDGLRPAGESVPADDPVRRAAEANRAMQRQVQDFYAPPARNAEIEVLKEQVAELQAQLDAGQRQPDPLELAEEQYRLARKYLGDRAAADEETEADRQQRNARLSVMRPVREGEVEASTLDPRADFTVERNVGFLTPTERSARADIPTVRACIARTQVVRAGSTVQLRLLEDVRIGEAVIPRNTPLYGTASLGGDRLQIVVSSVEYGGRIFDVEAAAYDMDGQRGPTSPIPASGRLSRRRWHPQVKRPVRASTSPVRPGSRSCPSWRAEACRRRAATSRRSSAR